MEMNSRLFVFWVEHKLGLRRVLKSPPQAGPGMLSRAAACTLSSARYLQPVLIQQVSDPLWLYVTRVGHTWRLLISAIK